MKLGEFIKNFSHNNIIRLVYKTNEGNYAVIFNDWNDVSMDHDVLNNKGIFRHYINNKVLGLATISFGGGSAILYPHAINIVIEKKDFQIFIEEDIDNDIQHSS